MKKLVLLFVLSVCSYFVSNVQAIGQWTDYFPFNSFDKTIWNPKGNASFDATNGVFIADQYGFGGWKFSSPLDLSTYKYLVVNFQTDPSGTGASVRAFDENSYWVKSARATFVTSTQAVLDLQNSKKTDDAGAGDVVLNPANIYIVGLWTYGWSGNSADNTHAVTIKDIYVTNNTDYSKPSVTTGENCITNDENELVDVYTIMGGRIRSKVLRKDATRGLAQGEYLVGNQKVLVTKIY